MSINLNNEFIKNILKMFSGSVISQIILIIGSLILARLYLPSQFGELSLFISIVSVLTIISTLRYENLIVIIKNYNQIKLVINFLIIFSSFISISLFIILLLVDKALLVKYNMINFYYYLPIGIFIYALFQIYTNINVREKKFNKVSKSKITLSFVTIIFQILFYFLHIKNGLIYGYIIGYLSAIFILYQKIEIKLIFDNLKKTKLVLKKYSYFLKHALPADLINNISSNIIPILIGTWFNMKIAGLYFLGYRIVNLPLQLISVSVGKVYFQKASELFINNKNELYNFTKKIVISIFIIVSIPLLLLFFYSEDIIQYILGNQWREAGLYISILTILFLTRTLFSPISHIADITKKMYVILFFSIYILIITISSFFIGHILNNFKLAIILYSIFSAIGYMFLLIYFLNLLKGFKSES